MKKPLASVGISIFKLLGYTPFWLIYVWADILYLISYYLIRYRRKTVYKNLKNSFPEKTDAEIEGIAKAYFHHFSDLIVESIKAPRMSEKALNKRLKYKNPELLNELCAQGKSVALISGHYGNWEWAIALPKFIKHQVNVIYRPIHDEVLDSRMKQIRSRYGMCLIPARIALRTLIASEKTGEPTATCYLADQAAKKDTAYWLKFLNQETPVFPGSEIIATRFKQAVVFATIQKVRRGYYEVEFTKLFDDASQAQPFEVTKTQLRFLEEIIRKKPEYWLWSHKRWKHTRPQNIDLK